MDTFYTIGHLKATLDQHRPLDPAIARNLREDLILRWTYHANAIEGNTLTLRETKVALEGIAVGGASLNPMGTPLACVGVGTNRLPLPRKLP